MWVVYIVCVLPVGRGLWRRLTTATERVVKMDESSRQVPGTNSGGGGHAKLSLKWSLQADVKSQLNSALDDMKKSVINVKKSPWLLTRSSTYTDCWLVGFHSGEMFWLKFS